MELQAKQLLKILHIPQQHMQCRSHQQQQLLLQLPLGK
jgi:hypothetical protein